MQSKTSILLIDWAWLGERHVVLTVFVLYKHVFSIGYARESLLSILIVYK